MTTAAADPTNLAALKVGMAKSAARPPGAKPPAPTAFELSISGGVFTAAEWELLSPPQRRQVLRADRDSRVEARRLFAGFAAENIGTEMAAAGATPEDIAAAILALNTEAES